MKMMLEQELRPCFYVGEHEAKKGLFHCWSNKSIVKNAIVIGEASGTESLTVGLVELENGKLIEAWPSEIIFVDNKMKEFVFPEELK